MADEADLAAEQEQLFLAKALSNRKAAPKYTPTGQCLNCTTPFDEKDPNYALKIFCDKDCAEDFEQYGDKSSLK